jgi:glucose/arabinose dehydrogenase
MSKEGRVFGQLAVFILLCLSGCFTLDSSKGGGQGVAFTGQRRLNPASVALPPGYSISIVASGLNYPTGVCFDDQGEIYLIESGGPNRLPRLLHLHADSPPDTIASGESAVWNGVAFDHGNFYVSALGADGVGRILKITKAGAITVLADHLPGLGESHPTGPIISGDYLYFGESSATNSGIAGLENASGPNRPFHDIPAADIKLSGQNVQTPDPASLDGTPAVTGPYSGFGQAAAPGQIVAGQVPCTGGVMRIPLAGGPPELVAWGLRDPAGLAFAADGTLFVTDQMYEDRGSRPVAGCGDLLWSLKTGLWYGWPDFFGTLPISNYRQFAPVGEPPPRPLLAEYPNQPPAPAAVLSLHAGAAGFDFSRNPSFGHPGEAFIAEFGDTSPLAGKLLAPVGFQVLRVDPATGVSHVFAVNNSDDTGPASKLGGGGLERPIAARFNPAGDALYVVDYGVVTVDQRLEPRPQTGVLWKITRKAAP